MTWDQQGFIVLSTLQIAPIYWLPPLHIQWAALLGKESVISKKCEQHKRFFKAGTENPVFNEQPHRELTAIFYMAKLSTVEIYFFRVSNEARQRCRGMPGKSYVIKQQEEKGKLNPTQTLCFSILFHLSWAFAAAMASTTKVVVI